MSHLIFLSFLLYILYINGNNASKCDYTKYHPKRYPVYHLNNEILNIDGKMDENAWKQVPWTDSFMDIQGPNHWNQPWFNTKIKMRYDDENLYIAAYLEETEIWGFLTEPNSVIYHDNDFEVFVDPLGTTHNYKEIELNALNTQWNLLLNRPYRNGGHENSSRVDKDYGFDMSKKGMKTNVYIKGKPNDPNQRLKYWTLEMALPLKELVYKTKAQVPPKEKSYWRINFSRVEWLVKVENGKYVKLKQPEENWVWSPQYHIAMHMPEYWGYIQFLTTFPSFNEIVPMDPEWNLRYVTFQYYYAQEKYFKQYQIYTTSIQKLKKYFSNKTILNCLQILSIDPRKKNERNELKSYRALLKLANGYPKVAKIQDDGYLEVETSFTNIQ